MESKTRRSPPWSTKFRRNSGPLPSSGSMPRRLPLTAPYWQSSGQPPSHRRQPCGVRLVRLDTIRSQILSVRNLKNQQHLPPSSTRSRHLLTPSSLGWIGRAEGIGFRLVRSKVHRELSLWAARKKLAHLSTRPSKSRC